jgi:hypothetical protein
MNYLNLSIDQRYQLAQALAANMPCHIQRKRLQSIELCDRGLPIYMISRLLDVEFSCIHAWLVQYEQKGLSGLVDQADYQGISSN